MYRYSLLILLFFYTAYLQAQGTTTFPETWFLNEVSNDNPYGKLNSGSIAPPADFDKLIGDCDCKSVRALPNGKWSDSVSLKWKWKYIMNGNAVQDEGWYGDEKNPSYFTSVRVFNNTKKEWYVSYFTPNMLLTPDIWTGKKEGDQIILKGEIKTPNGKLLSMLIFSEISPNGFNWEGKILSDKNDTVGKSFWKISCKKIAD